MDGWGAFYKEFNLGFFPPDNWNWVCRNDIEMIVFYGFGQVATVQKITTFEFDGWEVWSTWSEPERYESVARARDALRGLIAHLEENAEQQ